jgi:hypothetical protein
MHMYMFMHTYMHRCRWTSIDMGRQIAAAAGRSAPPRSSGAAYAAPHYPALAGTRLPRQLANTLGAVPRRRSRSGAQTLRSTAAPRCAPGLFVCLFVCWFACCFRPPLHRIQATSIPPSSRTCRTCAHICAGTCAPHLRQDPSPHLRGTLLQVRGHVGRRRRTCGRE